MENGVKQAKCNGMYRPGGQLGKESDAWAAIRLGFTQLWGPTSHQFFFLPSPSAGILLDIGLSDEVPPKVLLSKGIRLNRLPWH